MANGNLEVKLSLEKTIHSGIEKVIKDIFKDHGLVIQQITVEWIDVSTPEKFDLMLKSVELHTIKLADEN